MTTSLTYGLQLPWSISNDDQKFKKILSALLVLYIAIALPVIVIKVPELTREEKEQLPPQLARILLEKQVLPVPKPVEQPKIDVEKKLEKPIVNITPVAKESATKNPMEKKSTSQLTSKPSTASLPESSQQQTAVTQARERAANSGLMQFKDDLAEMRESLQTESVASANTTVSANAGNAKTQVERSMLTSGVTKASGGVNTAAYSRDTGGTALSGREATKVKSGLADATKKASGATAGGANSDGAGGAARSEEEVRKIMEQHKGAIFTIYNKALRDDATLQGRVVVKMVIDPNGRIIDATIVSSALQSPELELKLLQRIKLITFSASNVIRTTLNYSFDFLPQ